MRLQGGVFLQYSNCSNAEFLTVVCFTFFWKALCRLCFLMITHLRLFSHDSTLVHLAFLKITSLVLVFVGDKGFYQIIISLYIKIPIHIIYNIYNYYTYIFLYVFLYVFWTSFFFVCVWKLQGL